MKRLLALVLVVSMVLTACSAKSGSQSNITDSSESAQTNSDSGKKPLSEYTIDPPYTFSPEEVTASFFGDYFLNEYENNKVSTYYINENTPWQNEVTKIESGVEGPTVYIVASVHGDETAAWIAADMIKKSTIKAGTVHVLSPANPWGRAQSTPSRYITGEEDLNRSFPGNSEGTVAEVVADAIFKDIEKVNPDFVFDLHEARIVSSGRDFLGSSLIFTDLKEQSDMFFNLILDSQMGMILSEPFKFYSPGPVGSLNNTVSTLLNVPTVTVETFRGYEMEIRVGDQIAVVEYMMREFGMID